MAFGKGFVAKHPESNATLEVADEVKAVVMQNSDISFQLVRNAIPAEECLITPLVNFHTIELFEPEEKEERNYRYKATIPHYLSRKHNFSRVKVRYGDINKPDSLTRLRKGNPEKVIVPCYKIGRKTITIYCNHFCDIVCTSTEKVCTSKILALPFGRIGPDSSNLQTFTKVKTYVCSFLYSDKKLQLVSLYSNPKFLISLYQKILNLMIVFGNIF